MFYSNTRYLYVYACLDMCECDVYVFMHAVLYMLHCAGVCVCSVHVQECLLLWCLCIYLCMKCII